MPDRARVEGRPRCANVEPAGAMALRRNPLPPPPPRCGELTERDHAPPRNQREMFTDFGFDPALVRGIDGLGFAEPTPIQRDAIPPALSGRDVLACATTGTGKTAAFLLPILQRLIATRSRKTRALVLAPTRELAAQIEAHFRDLAAHTRLRAAAVFGGTPMPPQVRAFRTGVDVVVATPGRLLDHLQQPHGRLDGLEVLVLDEADRMLDMGFLPDVRRILKQLPDERQTML